MKPHNVLHSTFQSFKVIRARRAGTVFVPSISYPPSLQAASFLSSSGADVLILAHEQVFEGLFEGGVTECIASGVNGAVDVAEPVANGPDCVWNARLAECAD